MSGTSHSEVSVTDVDESELHRLLWDEQRRTVIDVLSEAERAVELAALARAVADRDGVPQENARVQLHHVHLPMLADVGVVDYDRDASVVVPHPPLYGLAT